MHRRTFLLVFALSCSKETAPPSPGSSAPPAPVVAPPTAPAAQAPLCSDDHWCWANPLPQGNSLRAIWASGPDDVWAGGDSGVLVHFDGHTWQRAHNPVWNQRASRVFHYHFGQFTDVVAIWGARKDDVWAASDRALLHWDGKAWVERTADLGALTDTEELYDLFGSAPNDAWIVVRNGPPLHWDGKSWQRVAIDPELIGQPYPYAMWASAPGDVWLVGAGGKIFHREGTTWKPSPSGVTGALVSVFGSSKTDLWVTGEDGALLHGDGSTWTAIGGVKGTLASGRAIAPNDAWALRGDELVHYDGHTWTAVASAPKKPSALFVLGHEVYLAAGGAVVHGAGTTWSPAPARADAKLAAIAGSDDRDVWAVGDDGAIVHGDASGWRAVPSGSKNPHLIAVWASGKDDAWTGGYGGELLHWDGHAWQPIASGTKSYIFSIWGTARDDVWVAGSEGLLLHWDGKSFTTISTKTTKLFSSVTGSARDDVWAVGPEVALHWDGKAWSPDPAAAKMSLDKLWVAPHEAWGVMQPLRGLEGQIVHFDGKTWSRVPTIPELAGKPCLLAGTCGFNAKAVWGRAPDDVWIGGEVGVMHWDGKAWSWSDLGSDTADLVGLWGHGDHVFAVGHQGAILHREK